MGGDKMLDRIKKIREEAYTVWDEGLSIAEVSGVNDIRFIKKKAEAEAMLRASEMMAEEHGIDLNDHYNEYGEWIN
jgi:heptaprenylglyceryl phosphate synthase